MVTETTERNAVGKLEQALASESKADVSEEEPTENETLETTAETSDAETADETAEDEDEIPFTAKQEAEISRRIQSEADKRANKYRSEHETDVALLRQYQEEVAELKRSNRAKAGEKRLSRLMDTMDDEGYSDEEKRTFKEQLTEINKEIDDYNDKVGKVESTISYIDQMAKNMDAGIVKQFRLNDPNPNIRASGGLELIDEAISNIKEYKNFLRAVETFFPKNGNEVRQKLDSIIKGMADYGDNEKAIDLYLSSQAKGFNPTPKKAPSRPSSDGGGEDISRLSPKEKIDRGLRQKAK